MLALSAGEVRAALLGDILKPFASVEETYDSNIFRVRDRDQLKALTGSDRLDDFITVWTVGTGIRYTLGGQGLNLLLKRDFIRYSRHGDQDADSDTATGNLALTVVDKVKINIDGVYSKIPESRAGYRSAGLNKITNIAGGISAGYETTAGIGFEAAYRRVWVDYSLPELKANEYSIDRYSGTVSYRLSTETKVYASYLRDYTNYDEDSQSAFGPVNNNSVSDSVRLGLDKTFSPKTSVSGYVGYLDRRYKAFSVSDFNGLIGRAEVRYGLTAKLGLLVNAERQLYEETFTDRIYSVNDAVGADLVYQITAKTKVSVFDRLIWKRFKDIPDSGVPKRTDRLNEIGALIEWAPLGGLHLNLGYRYSRRTSDDHTFDFDDHTVTTGIGYDFR